MNDNGSSYRRMPAGTAVPAPQCSTATWTRHAELSGKANAVPLALMIDASMGTLSRPPGSGYRAAELAPAGERASAACALGCGGDRPCVGVARLGILGGWRPPPSAAAEPRGW